MKRKLLCFLAAIILCLHITACNKTKDSQTPVSSSETGEILSMPELTEIGSYRVEGISLILNDEENHCTLNICLKNGSSFDYTDTAVCVEMNGTKKDLELLINNSNWALYSVSDVEYATEIAVQIKDISGNWEKTIPLDESRYELYKASFIEPVWGLSARAYTLSAGGNLIFLEFSNSSDNGFLKYFIQYYDLKSAGAEMVYLNAQGEETEILEMGGMLGPLPFTGQIDSYLILRPANASEVSKIRIKSIYVSKTELSEDKIKEFDELLKKEDDSVEIQITDEAYTIYFESPLDILIH